MLSSTILIKSILGILGSAALFYLVGCLFNYLLNKRKVYWGWMPTYFYLMCGMVLSISFFAIVKTKGITILSILPLLLVLFSLGFHKQFVFEEVKELRKKVEPFLFLLLATAFSYCYYLQSFRVEGDIINFIWGDQEYYARVAENISFLGIENMRVEYLYPDRFTLEPFHYGDLWSVALAFTISSLKPIFGGVLVSYPLLMALSSLGIAALVQHFILKGNKPYLVYLLLVMGLIGGFGFLFPGFIFPGSVDVYARSMSNYTKLLWWASILPMVFAMILNRSERLVVYLVFIIGLGYINVLPTLAMGSFLWIFYIAFKRKELLPNIIQMIWVTVIAVIFVYALYSFYPSLSSIKRPVSGKAVFSLAAIISHLKTSVNIFIGGFFQLFVYLPPFLLLLLHFWLEKVKFKTASVFDLLIYSLALMISALFVWALLFTTTMEAIQFFYNVFVVVAGLLSAVIYVYVLANSSKPVLKIAALLLFCFSVFNNLQYDINVKSVNKNERDALFSFVNKSEKKTFAHYRDVRDYSADFFSSGTLTAMPYSILGYHINRYENFSLNIPFAVFDTTRREYPFQKNNADWAPMSYFVKQRENAGLTQDELMQKFMSTNKIAFVCIPIDVAIPVSLSTFVTDSLYTPKMGWKIYSCAYASGLKH